MDAGIIGDAPLLFALANGAPVKAIAVDKSNPAGTAVLVSPGSTLKSGADLKGKRIATGKGSIGHFVALKALEQAAALRFSAIEANLAKVTITDNAIQAVNIALELTGNHGLSRQNPLERHYRNVLCGRVHTPQSDSAWLAAGNFVFQSQG